MLAVRVKSVNRRSEFRDSPKERLAEPFDFAQGRLGETLSAFLVSILLFTASYVYAADGLAGYPSLTPEGKEGFLQHGILRSDAVAGALPARTEGN